MTRSARPADCAVGRQGNSVMSIPCPIPWTLRDGSGNERSSTLTTSVHTAVAMRRTACAFQCVYQSRSEEHTSELQSRLHLVCRLLLEKKNSGSTQYQLVRTAGSNARQ